MTGALAVTSSSITTVIRLSITANAGTPPVSASDWARITAAIVAMLRTPTRLSWMPPRNALYAGSRGLITRSTSAKSFTISGEALHTSHGKLEVRLRIANGSLDTRPTQCFGGTLTCLAMKKSGNCSARYRTNDGSGRRRMRRTCSTCRNV